MKGVKRLKAQGRIVITLDVEVSQLVMADAPPWQTDAVDVLRKVVRNECFSPHLGSLFEMLKEHGVEAYSTTIEAAK